MSLVFLSHSSSDKTLTRRIASDLEKLGHDVWMDEWEIRVGDCIPTKIGEGLEDAEYVILILSSHSVASGWVDREWKAKYWTEVEAGRTLILPAMVDDCEVPLLLRSRRYADLRGDNYAVGLVNLAAAISPVIDRGNAGSLGGSLPQTNPDVVKLIRMVQSREQSVSACLLDALEFAAVHLHGELRKFCEDELRGYEQKTKDEDRPKYRTIEIFVSPTHEINMQYFGWGRSAQNVLSELRRTPDHFHPVRLFVSFPAQRLEAKLPDDPHEALLRFDLRLGQLIPETTEPDAPLFGYGDPSSYVGVLESIRGELTRRLLDLLPGAGSV